MIPQYIIDSYVKKMEVSPKQGEMIFKNLEKFLDEAYTGKVKSPNASIDKAWHHFILFTKQYMDYCKCKYSALIHHVPLDNHGSIKCMIYVERCETGNGAI